MLPGSSFFVLNLFQPSVAFHIATNHLICTANPMTGFYVKRSTELKWVNLWINVLTARFPRWLRVNKKRTFAIGQAEREKVFLLKENYSTPHSGVFFSIEWVFNNLVCSLHAFNQEKLIEKLLISLKKLNILR